MTRHIAILTVYFAKSLFFSLAGVILLIFSLIYWAVLFPPGQGTPDVENYIILIGALGAVVTFLAALSIAGRASRLENYPLLVRLPSRIEYMSAVMLSALTVGLILQALVAILALIRGPELSTAWLLSVPPLWLSLNVLAVILALHASDLVAAGWSRVIIFGLLALLLILDGAANSSDSWLAERLTDLATVFMRMNLMWFGDLLDSAANALRTNALASFSGLASFVFWPFRAMRDAVISGGFTASQALAPAVVLLYGTILFLVAASLFAGKDLDFIE